MTQTTNPSEHHQPDATSAQAPDCAATGHQWQDGVCQRCGLQCTHPETDIAWNVQDAFGFVYCVVCGQRQWLAEGRELAPPPPPPPDPDPPRTIIKMIRHEFPLNRILGVGLFVAGVCVLYSLFSDPILAPGLRLFIGVACLIAGIYYFFALRQINPVRFTPMTQKDLDDMTPAYRRQVEESLAILSGQDPKGLAANRRFAPVGSLASQEEDHDQKRREP